MAQQPDLILFVGVSWSFREFRSTTIWMSTMTETPKVQSKAATPVMELYARILEVQKRAGPSRSEDVLSQPDLKKYFDEQWE
ncbi:MAG: hypothetical protein HWE26_16240 [Alteromonadaceae bacterium]|nr:hypothetical protein [Alteromonadaceae bacterium]